MENNPSGSNSPTIQRGLLQPLAADDGPSYKGALSDINGPAIISTKKYAINIKTMAMMVAK
jgi:hypothetical protein